MSMSRVTCQEYLVYAIRCIPNGKIYIGRTTNLKNRLDVHFNSLKLSKHTNELLQEDFNKYGIDNFEIYEIENNIPIKNKYKEYEYMRIYNTYDKKFGYNYNDKTKVQKKEFDVIIGLPENLFEKYNLEPKEKEE